MTKEEKIRGLYNLKEYLVKNPIELDRHKSLPITLIDYAIESLEQQPCEDCISRETVLKIFDEACYIDGDWYVMMEKIEKLPSVTPTRPKGKWIDNSEEDSYYANCSHCNYQIDTHYERGYLNYCPNCGAKMEVDGGRRMTMNNGEKMDFLNSIDEFLSYYSFMDKEEVYTSGISLIPTFRVKQAIEHYYEDKDTESDDELLTPEERADVLNAINDMLEEQGFNLEVGGYEDTNGVIFNVSLIRR